MSDTTKNHIQLKKRANRVRAKLHGTAGQPRLSVHISLLHVSAQLIDDDKSITIASASTVGRANLKGSLTEKSVWVGAEIAKKAKAKKIRKVVFDRGPKLYHGRIQELAEEARKQGLEF